MRMFDLFYCKKTQKIFESYSMSARTRGRGVNFLRLCTDVLYGGLLAYLTRIKSSAAASKHAVIGQKYFRRGKPMFEGGAILNIINI